MVPRANWKGGSTEQLPRDIDSGRSGDKVDWRDPAIFRRMNAAQAMAAIDFATIATT